MKDAFINEVMHSLYSVIPEEYLCDVKNKLCIITKKYDINIISTEIDTWHGQLPQCFEYFLVTKKIEGLSDKTIYNYRNFITDMFLTIHKPIEEISANDVRAYLWHLKDIRGISNRTLDNRRSVLNSFFSWIAAEGYIGKNPMLTIKPIKCEKKERESLTSLEMEIIRSACVTDRERAIIEFLSSTACRVSELVSANIADIDFSTGSINVFGKGNKERRTYVNSRAVVLIRKYLDSRDDDCAALFVSDKMPHNRLRKEGIEKIVKNIGKRVGIKLYPHLIRHTSATLAINKGMPATSLQKMLGHASLDTTMIYAKVSQNEVKLDHYKYIS